MKRIICAVVCALVFTTVVHAKDEESLYDISPDATKKNFVPQDTTLYKTSSDAEKAQKLKKIRALDERYYYSKDNKKMVLVPAQAFIMGSDSGSDLEKPAHKVRVQAFYMDETEVTNAQFQKFLKATGYKPMGSMAHSKDRKFNDPSQPVVDVDYYDALEYAKWAGKRLPTEAEWECAAKDSNNYEYATGNAISPEKAKYGERMSQGNPAPVKSFRPNSRGIYDLSGNAAEWVYGILDAYPGNKKPNAGYGKLRIPRGGSWFSKQEQCRTFSRSAIDISNSSGGVGFRCVIDYDIAKRRMEKDKANK
ncbi:MAG TPA: SUMF1/EgtB/PvdO family nonheme iron enzyme [Clostridiales bacterium]|nr:SUMF1/EgtB/PvdO family nonheme iron enzyme [Clostridiales bacterium]HQP68924.1 SUMF1/EgtB/PvdO family nonheme iron enzyme [Clostridiales bacterium]